MSLVPRSGVIIHTTKDGSRVQTNPDGVKIFIAPDGSQTQRDPDGTEISTGLDVRLRCIAGVAR